MDAARSLSLNQLLAGTANVQAVRQMQAQDASSRTEIARKATVAGSGAVTTDFSYSPGPDGQLYVNGGQVSTSRKVSARQLIGTRGDNAANDNTGDETLLPAPRRPASFGDFLPPRIALSSLDLALLQEARDTPLLIAELTQIDAGMRAAQGAHSKAASHYAKANYLGEEPTLDRVG